MGEVIGLAWDDIDFDTNMTTVDVYGHIIPDSNRNAVNQLDDEGDFGLRAISEAR